MQRRKSVDSDDAGRGFRSEVDRHSDAKPATIPIGRRPGATASPWVVVYDLDCDASGQVVGAFCLRRLSPASSMRYALWTTRSSTASASVGMAMMSYQRSTGT